jgi:D-amino peptidase
MKIYMLCDMEGVSGLYSQEHAWWWEPDARPYVYADEGRLLLTQDVNSAAAAALAAGVTELVVCDTHHGGGNFLWDQVLADPRITYERPQSPWLMPSLDETFDGLILLGHHAKAGTQGAFLDHGFSTDWFDFAINGMSIGEIGMETCYAGHWNVPLIMVQGDNACCAEAESQFPGVVTAGVKRGLGFGRAAGPAPAIARAATAKKAGEAIARVPSGAFRPFKPSLPITVRITATSTQEAERIARRPWAHRIDGRTVEARVERQCDILSWATG